jgi:hypothetical protein
LFDHLVGTREQHGRNGEAERPRGPSVEHKIELGELYRQIDQE